MKKENVKIAVNMLDDELVKEASKGRRISFKAVTAAALALVIGFAAVNVAQNTPTALINGIEKQAEAMVVTANEMDDYSDGEETVMFVENEIYLLETLAATEEINHFAPARDAVNEYKAELQELRARAKESLEAFREASKEYKGEKKLTAEQKKALRVKAREIRRAAKEARKAKRAVTAREIMKARRNNDVDTLNGYYNDICFSIETGMERLNKALDKLDELTEKLS